MKPSPTNRLNYKSVRRSAAIIGASALFVYGAQEVNSLINNMNIPQVNKIVENYGPLYTSLAKVVIQLSQSSGAGYIASPKYSFFFYFPANLAKPMDMGYTSTTSSPTPSSVEYLYLKYRNPNNNQDFSLTINRSNPNNFISSYCTSITNSTTQSVDLLPQSSGQYVIETNQQAATITYPEVANKMNAYFTQFTNMAELAINALSANASNNVLTSSDQLSC